MTEKINNKLHENDADLMIPNLWIGNKNAAHDEFFIRAHNIKYIVNITDGINSPFNFITYYHIPIKDKKMCTEVSRKPMTFYIDNALKFIDNGISENVGVLVHCRKGHHRSAGIVLLYLMKKYKMGYIPTCIYINNIRPYALKRNTCVNKWIIHYYKDHISDFI